MAKYRITNYGATRKFPYKGQYYEIAKNSSIETDDKQLADEFGKFQFVDIEAVEQPAIKAKKRKVATEDKQKD